MQDRTGKHFDPAFVVEVFLSPVPATSTYASEEGYHARFPALLAASQRERAKIKAWTPADATGPRGEDTRSVRVRGVRAGIAPAPLAVAGGASYAGSAAPVTSPPAAYQRRAVTFGAGQPGQAPTFPSPGHAGWQRQAAAAGDATAWAARPQSDGSANGARHRSSSPSVEARTPGAGTTRSTATPAAGGIAYASQHGEAASRTPAPFRSTSPARVGATVTPIAGGRAAPDRTPAAQAAAAPQATSPYGDIPASWY
jgi:hypothetical protein